ncbi:MAG: radical SAM protein [Bacteroidales bacterium]|jgi:radical SAM protein with 4Fe4S-binding SPASM domain|nr:radical SAM protein [Bacteroidales bacterium]
MNKTVYITLSKDDTLCFPEFISSINFQGRNLIISPSTANWIILDEKELNIFYLIKEKKVVNEILKTIGIDQSLLFLKVITNILSRKFAGINYTPTIKFNTEKSAYFAITNRCNLNCPHCYIETDGNNIREISINEWISISEEFAEIGGKCITLTGGEILLKSGWIDLVKHIHSLGLKQCILTNGVLWSDAQIEKASKYVNEIQVSVDGIDEHSNSVVRGKGNFKLAISTATKFDTLGVKSSIFMTPLFEGIKYFTDGFMEFYDKYIISTDIKIRLSKKLLPVRNAKSLSYEYQELYRYYMTNLEDTIYPHHRNANFFLSHLPNEGIDNCGLGRITVDAHGYIYPCNRIKQFVPIFHDALHGLKYSLEQLESWAKLFSVENIEGCKSCDLKYICGGGCRLIECLIMKNNKIISFKKSFDPNIIVKRRCECTELSKNILLTRMINIFGYTPDRNYIPFITI